MTKKLSNQTLNQNSPLGVIIEEDIKQSEFHDAVNQWTEGKISYESMYEKIPSARFTLRTSIIQRIIDSLRRRKTVV